MAYLNDYYPMPLDEEPYYDPDFGIYDSVDTADDPTEDERDPEYLSGYSYGALEAVDRFAFTVPVGVRFTFTVNA